jgi:acyl-CoA hydrolase
MINRRSPHQVGKQIAKGINEGRIKFFDKHLSMFPVDLVYVSRPIVALKRDNAPGLSVSMELTSSKGILYERQAQQ